MTTNIKLKKSSVVGRAPGAGDLDYGEIAINYADGKLYYKNSSNQIKSFIDSASVQNLIDNVPTGGGGVSGGLDSSAVYTLIDSAYIQARETSANGISNVSQYTRVADSGQTIFDNVSFVNDDNIQVFLNGILLRPTEDYATLNNNTITLTVGADSGDEFRLVAFETYSQRVSLDDYSYTCDSGTTTFSGVDNNNNTLSYTPGNVQVHYNGLLLVEGQDYTATNGTSVVLTDAADSGDAVVITAISGDSAYIRNAVSESFLSTIIDSAYVQARIGDISGGTDSSTVISLIGNTVDSAYIQSRQITYSNISEFSNDEGYTTYDSANTTGMLSTYATQTYVTNQINNLIDGAPTTLDTLNEIAAALNDDDSAFATLNNVINTKTSYDSANTIQLVDSAYIASRQSNDSATNSQKLNGLRGAYYLDYINFTNTPDILDSNNIIGLIDSAYVQARQLDSAVNAQQLNNLSGSYYLNYNNFTNTPNVLDSGHVTNIVTSYNYTTYDSANTTGMLNSYATKAYVDSHVSAIIDGAPDALNTLNEIAAALNDDDSAFATLNNLINAKTSYDSSNASAQIEAYGYTTYDSINTIQLVDSAYVQARQLDSVTNATNAINATLLNGYNTSYYINYNNFINTPNVLDSSDISDIIVSYGYSTYDSSNAAAQIEAYGYLTSAIDSANVIALITANDQQRDSSFVTGIIDSAYVQSRQIQYDVLDSANVISLITANDQQRDSSFVTGIIDSAYVNARVTSSGGATDSNAILNLIDSDYIATRAGTFGRVSLTENTVIADSGQTVFNVSYVPNAVQVYFNGILLSNGFDYTATNGTSIVLSSGADSGDTIVINTIGGDSVRVQGEIEFVVDSAYVQSRQIQYDVLDSANVIALITENDQQRDSSFVTDIIDTAYIQANQTKFADSAYVALQISNLVDGAPVALDTLNELATALQNDSDALASLVTVVDTKLNTSQVTSLVDSAYVQSRQITYDFLDSGEAINLIDSDYIESRRPAAAIFNVVNSDASSYKFTGDGFDSADNPTLYLQRGLTYKFNIDAVSHPFEIRVSDGGSAYNTGVTNNGQNNGELTFSVPMNGPNTLVYQCTIHAGMIGNIVLLSDTSYLDSSEILSLVATQGYLTDTLDSSEILSLVAAQGYLTNALDSAEVISLIGNQGYLTDAIDSNEVLNLIDSDYIQARQIVSSGEAGTDSSTVLSLITSTVDSDYIQARQLDGGSGTDSATVLSLITSTVDSAYVALREANAGVSGSGGGLDSNAAINLIDSAYINARSDVSASTIYTSVEKYIYTADSGQTLFSGADDGGNNLSYFSTQQQVYLNGILLIDSADYTATTGNSITLNTPAEADDIVTISSFRGGTNATIKTSIVAYEFITDSGQTTITGTDRDGKELQYGADTSVLVYANGILLVDSTDYSASNGTSITFTEGFDSGDIINVIKMSSSGLVIVDALVDSVGVQHIANQTIAATVDSAYINSRVAAGVDSAAVISIIATDGFTKYDSSNTLGLIDSAYVNSKVDAGTDSATVETIVLGLVDSAYIGARADAGTDSATVETIVLGLVDSAFIQLRQRDNYVELASYEFLADSGQTSFSGTDDYGNTLNYTADNILVHLNGILLSDSADYTASNGTSIILADGTDSADIVHITTFASADNPGVWGEVDSSSYNAAIGQKLIVDTSSNAVTVTLPGSPSFGDEVKIIDGTGDAESNNITINRNGNKILGADSDFTLDVNRVAVDLVYYNAAQGWIISGSS